MDCAQIPFPPAPSLTEIAEVAITTELTSSAAEWQLWLRLLQEIYPICVSTRFRNRSGWNGGKRCRGAAAVVGEVDVTLLIVIARVLPQPKRRGWNHELQCR